MSEWIAEDLPWHEVDPRTRHAGMTDEDYAMSAGRTIQRSPSERAARNALWIELTNISYLSHLSQRESTAFRDAADALDSGADGVRIAGRYYAVRKAS